MNISEQLSTLYLKDSKGKVRVWSVHTEGADVVVTYGQQDKKMVEKRTTAKPKNMGKKNETTAEEQAQLEAQSKWTKQVEREDYNEDVELSGQQVRPMLSLDYNKVPHRVDWSQAYIQPKLDGVRLVFGNRYPDNRSLWPEMMSRKGDTYTLAHLEDPCKELLDEVRRLSGDPYASLDGEAYKHGMPLQQIVSRAKKYHEGKTEELEYWIFDIVTKGTFAERQSILFRAYNNVGHCTNVVVVVDGCYTQCESDMFKQHNEYTEQGYEGIMIRHVNSLYECHKRGSGLFKYKHFYDDEFKIIDVWEDNYGNAMFTVEGKAGQELSCREHVFTEDVKFGCTPKRTHDERKVMLQHKEDYIGQMLTVKYQSLSDDFVPTFPVGLALREYTEYGEAVI